MVGAKYRPLVGWPRHLLASPSFWRLDLDQYHSFSLRAV